MINHIFISFSSVQIYELSYSLFRDIYFTFTGSCCFIRILTEDFELSLLTRNNNNNNNEKSNQEIKSNKLSCSQVVYLTNKLCIFKFAFKLI